MVCLIGPALRKVLESKHTIPIASSMEGFLATGNLRSRSGLNLQQVEHILCYFLFSIIIL